jgi:serine/threonine-protein kinase
MTLPAVFLFVGHLTLTTKHFLITEQGKEKSDKEGAESNKMLGLAFQQQGQLDMAFDKFRRVPPSDDLMDVLYNLAMDFERKRQFNKASAVYNYIAKHDPSFRDIKQRTKRANDAQDTIIFGAKAVGGGPGDTLIGEGGFEKPMLGRYQVEKELGRGAMGIVYQGRDPKINRVVAIKTLSLAEEFEAEELQEIKERFFREAEAAGRLNHPGIVTVYDAGEEHDLAYIAMEFLSGHDLLRYTKPDALLPVEKVLNLMLRAAEALDYAHTHTIVHRDIKPANLMYDPEIDQLKVTDFGIARVSNSSKTKTGMVVGTPSYMSPEQVTGKRVDGRSDIFSLGVMLYQLLTSELPFQAENATQIMYKIATEKHPNILETRPGIKRSAPWISIVLNRALEKDIDKRYQRGQLMANDIKAVLKKMAAASQRAKQ